MGVCGLLRLFAAQAIGWNVYFGYWRGWKIIGVFEVHSKPPSWITHLLDHFEGLWEFMGLPGYLHSKPLPLLGL